MTRRYTGGFLSATEQATDANTSNGIYTLQEAGQATAVGNFPTGGWTPSRSLRFRSGASANLSRTPAANGNQRTWTWSAWVKRGALTSDQMLFAVGNTYMRFGNGSDDTLWLNFRGNGGTNYFFQTTQKFRDPSAWYHIVLAVDTTQALAANRVKLYSNGVRINEFTTYADAPPQNHDTAINSTSYHTLGSYSTNVIFFDGYMADVNLIDGQELTPSAFGQTDAATGMWEPKRYTGTYGTNGFYLDFRDNSGATATTLGADRSGNSNNFTPNNFSLTAGTTYDSMVDVPGIASVSNQVDIGGVQRGNYATLNPLFPGGYTLTEGNLYASGSSAITVATMGIPPGSGKFYWEATQVNTTNQNNNIPVIGMTRIDSRKIAHDSGGTAGSRNVYWYTDSVFRFEVWVENGVTVSSRTASFNGCAAGDVVMFAYDSNTGKWWYGKNGSWADGLGGTTGSPSTGYGPVFTIPTDSTMTPFLDHAGTNADFRYNFGQRAFAYAPPTGFKSICSTNLPNPIIKRPEQHFDVRTWGGNGSNLTIGVNSKESSAYPIERSLKFNASASGHLTRTPASASNRRTWTYSAWIKRSVLGTRQSIFSAGTGNNSSAPGGGAYFTSSTNKIEYIMGGGTSCAVTTDRPFTDTIAWMHLVIAMDTTQVAPAQRLKMYVDGVQITGFSATTYPNQNFETDVNNAVIHAIGSRTDDGTMPNTVANYYLAEVNFIDGSAKIPSDFGAYDANNNWVPQRYTGTYGTNGFYLPFNQVPTTSTFAASFNGSNQGLLTTASGLNASTGTWTVEGWAFSTNSAANEAIITGQVSGSDYFYWNYGGTTLYFGDGVTNTIVLNSVKPTNRWFHWAAVKNGSTYTLYIDGRAIGSSTTAFRSGTLTQWQIGQRTSQSYFWSGYISNVRVNTTTAVYTTNFKPPVAPLTAISGTQLLTLQSATIVDNSTNGYTFTNNGSVATTASTIVFANGSVLASDQSGNNNVWSGNNILVTSSASGVTDSVFDSPADSVNASGNIIGNYAVLNSGDKGSVVTVSNGGLGWAQSTTTAQSIRATLPMPTGKWYWELNAASNNSPGIMKQSGSISAYVGGDSKGWSYFVDGTLYNNNSNVSFGATHNSSDIISVAFDADTGKLWFAKNNTWQASGDPATGANAIIVPLDPTDLYYPAMSTSVTGAVVGTVNFGQSPFTYTPPTGFKALNSKNLKDVGSYNLPDSFGNFVTTPDLAWMKSRTNGGYRHQWLDTVRGPRNVLFSTDNTEQQTYESVQSFIPNGVTLGPEVGTNELGSSNVGWFWNRGKTPGFDIVTYGGDGVNGRMIPHNLGQEPAFYITKCLTTYNNSQSFTDWSVYHKDCPTYTGNSRQGKQALWLHRDLAAANGVGGFFNTATSAEFSPNQTLYDNAAGQSYVAYLWAQVPGFSQFGSYVGNGSTNGPFVYTGFKPAFILTKNITTAGYWWEIVDNKRSPFNPSNKTLYANVTDTEYTGSGYNKDLLSNGFKMRGNSAGHNSSGDTFVYAAFAENPFKYGNAR